MARAASLLLLFSVLCVAGNGIALATSSDDTAFIKNSCKSTTYPKPCMQSLLPYASKIHQSPRQIVLFALSVSKSKTQSAKSFVSKLRQEKNLKPREYEAIAVCLNQMSESLYYLRKSVQALTQNVGEAKGEKEYLRRLSIVKAWVSAALTDDETCLDGFADKAMDGEVKDSIRGKVVNIAKHTSNALALVNKFVY